MLCMTYFSLVNTQGITFCSTDLQMTSCEFPAHCVNSSSGLSCVCSDGFVGYPPLCEGIFYQLVVNMFLKGLLEEVLVPERLELLNLDLIFKVSW